MSEWVIGYGAGMCIGIAIGIVIGKKKPENPTPEEKKRIMIGIALGVISLLAGVAAFLAVGAA